MVIMQQKRWLFYVAAAVLVLSSCIEAESGVCSYYGSEAQGAFTASGERFDKNKLTAAHKTLPFGTRVKVTNPSNGKSVVVRINDRGPFTPGRILDLSEAAFARIESLGKGIFNCRYTRA